MKVEVLLEHPRQAPLREAQLRLEAAMTEAGWIIAHTHLGPQGGNTLA